MTRHSLESLKHALERFGATNDAATRERPQRMLNITRQTGEFLSVLVRAMRATRVLEIGTSNGYSTLWLADAVHSNGGQVTTIESSEYKVGLARANFELAGLDSTVVLVHEDAGRYLHKGADDAYDVVFLDSDRHEYAGWWPELRRILRPAGLLVVDNATSHVEEMAPFVSLVAGDADFTTCLVPVGNGEFLAVKRPS